MLHNNFLEPLESTNYDKISKYISYSPSIYPLFIPGIKDESQGFPPCRISTMVTGPVEVCKGVANKKANVGRLSVEG